MNKDPSTVDIEQSLLNQIVAWLIDRQKLWTRREHSEEALKVFDQLLPIYAMASDKVERMLAMKKSRFNLLKLVTIQVG